MGAPIAADAASSGAIGAPVAADAASGAMGAPIAADAASGAKDTTSFDIRDIGRVLQENKVDHISWHVILNNHASTRPIAQGGKLCESLKACTQFDMVGTNHWFITWGSATQKRDH